jgi:hypothetical protein
MLAVWAGNQTGVLIQEGVNLRSVPLGPQTFDQLPDSVVDLTSTLPGDSIVGHLVVGVVLLDQNPKLVHRWALPSSWVRASHAGSVGVRRGNLSGRLPPLLVVSPRGSLDRPEVVANPGEFLSQIGVFVRPGRD